MSKFYPKIIHVRNTYTIHVSYNIANIQDYEAYHRSLY